jgi:hypothetical protein
LWKPWSVTVDDRPSRVLDAVDDSAPERVMFLADLVRMPSRRDPVENSA